MVVVVVMFEEIFVDDLVVVVAGLVVVVFPVSISPLLEEEFETVVVVERVVVTIVMPRRPVTMGELFCIKERFMFPEVSAYETWNRTEAINAIAIIPFLIFVSIP